MRLHQVLPLSTEKTDTHDAYTDDKGQISFDLGTGKTNDGIYILKEIKQVSGETIMNNDTGKETTVKYMANDSFIHVPMTNLISIFHMIFISFEWYFGYSSSFSFGSQTSFF